MLEKVRFLASTKECSKVEIVLVLVPALSYQAEAAVKLIKYKLQILTPTFYLTSANYCNFTNFRCVKISVASDGGAFGVV